MTDITYYEQPVLKKSPWKWTIPAYYYVGGATGASAVLAAAATAFDPVALPSLSVRPRYLSALGGAVSAALLIHDLGRPARFLYMLRVFRPTSPMSVGTYILIVFSTAAGLSAISRGRFSDAATLLAGVLGLGLCGYTGVLLSNTTVPVWKAPHRVMPVLFIGSAAASAASLFDLMRWNEREERAIRAYGLAGKLVELAAMKVVECNVSRIAEVGRPLHDGFSGLLWHTGKILSGASLALAFVPSNRKIFRRAAGVLGTLGALCMRFGIHQAGQRSALNPRATFQQQNYVHQRIGNPGRDAPALGR
jgi:formate-dependent nitrite reductase membrane component NrfD